MSDLEEERRAQAAWRPRRPRIAQPLIEALLQREFLAPEQAAAAELRQLSGHWGWARAQVPYYRDDARYQPLVGEVTRDTLAQLPVLTKHEVQAEAARLQPAALPEGERWGLWAASSGTTGRPTQVRFTYRSMILFGLYAQRLLRWTRHDPSGTQGVIRLARDLAMEEARAEELADGRGLNEGGWMYVGNWFHTGPMVAISRSNPVERLFEWLTEERPDYLVTFPGTLEMLVNAAQGTPVDSLRGLRTISAMLSDGSRRRIEQATGLPVHQNYGLNEIGVVAQRCEAGRYHVNAEHCLLEVVDDDGAPVAAGDSGRLLVTSLANHAMPLLRYDTGDRAQAVDGPCACGRTLPAIGRIVGRYRPMQHAPAGTGPRVNRITELFEALPLSALAGLREYQLAQARDGSFELRLHCEGEPRPALVEAVREAWDEVGSEDTPLGIRRVDDIPPGPGGKQQEFVSAFFPDPTAD